MIDLHVISLGAGVQSSTMALMAAHREIEPMPEGAIFADTQAEPAAVYEWLTWLEKQLPFPVYRVTHGDLFEAATHVVVSKGGNKYVKTSIPAFVRSPEGNQGIQVRQCTGDFKIDVITRKLRELRGDREVTQWIGISWDEYHRMKPSKQAWKVHRWPLIDLKMTREMCKKWMAEHGYPEPPRSACIFCPFHNDAEWHRLKTKDPESFAQAVTFEKEYQKAFIGTRMKGIPFLHRSLQPIDEVEFGGLEKDQLDLFGNECEGMCGV